MKICKLCKCSLSPESFSANKKSLDGFDKACITCRQKTRDYNRQYREKNIEKVTLSCTKWRQKRNKEISSAILSNTFPIKDRIKLWASKIKHSDSIHRNKKNLDLGIMAEKAIASLSIFPYLIFIKKRESLEPSNIAASLDRIDNDQDYSNNNTAVVPLWLNLAKGSETYEKLYEYIKHFLEENENL